MGMSRVSEMSLNCLVKSIASIRRPGIYVSQLTALDVPMGFGYVLVQRLSGFLGEHY